MEDEALAGAERRLLRAATQDKGLCLLTGPGGSGKTMLVRHLLESLEEEAYESVLLVPMPRVSDGHWILDRFARQLGVEEPARDLAQLLGQLYEQLAVIREEGRRAVLIIDEAQVLADQGSLGELRGLLNLEYEDRRLLTMILAGLPHLASKMAEGTDLAERVEIRVRVPALDPEGVLRYLHHRIDAVDGNPSIFEPGAIDAMVSFATGNPRRLNILADNSLYEAYLAGRTSATERDVARAAWDLGLSEEEPESEPISDPKPEEETSVFEDETSESTDDAESELDEVVAAHTNPPDEYRDPAETVAILPDPVPEQGPPKDEEIDDLFEDLVG
jgi:type II secretory pathway predicted ATPase ExeA